jgi:multidrug resistance efflux pump
MSNLELRSGFVRISLALILVVGIAVAGAYFYLGGSYYNSPTAAASTSETQDHGAQQPDILVRAVKPHYDKTFTMIERRPADVLPYYRADLETRVPGPVSMIRTDVGDVVKKGDLLVEVDVPDLKAKAEQQDAAWKLAQAQVDQKKAALKSAKAEVVVAEARTRSAVAKLNSDTAYYKFRQKQTERFQELLAQKSIDARLVDEQEDRREAAFEAVNAAKEAVETAKAFQAAAAAKVEQADADVKEAEREVDVRKAELAFAKAMLDYSTVEAPFDGVIVRRNVDPGFFVQNAGNGHAAPLLTIERNDIVTVVMRVPDNFAPFITPNTEAIFETATLPGVKIHGRVTRFPPSLVNPDRDRTMLVEVDLWNGSAEEYRQKMADPKFTSQLKKGMPGDERNGKPILPEVQGKLAAGRQLRMLPGMFGEMTLILRKFENAYMLPSSSIVIEGGNSYIYVVREGKAHLQPVKVQVDDGKLVKVELVDANGQVAGDLTGQEVVIISNQSELSEGSPVKETVIDDWRSLDNKIAKKDR